MTFNNACDPSKEHTTCTKLATGKCILELLIKSLFKTRPKTNRSCNLLVILGFVLLFKLVKAIMCPPRPGTTPVNLLYCRFADSKHDCDAVLTETMSITASNLAIKSERGNS